jgi:hypothetical protein
MKTFYLTEGGNWGDCFTPFLFREHYGVEIEQCGPEQAALFSTGSILSAAPDGFAGHVLGSGLMDFGHGNNRDFRLDPLDLTSARVHLLRGHQTRNLCVIGKRWEDAVVLGDPGILAYLLAKPTSTEFEHGVIPHYVEQNNPQIELWRSRGANIIDVQSGVQNVIDEANKCAKIVSSSLHGLVLADSLGIPNHMVRLHDYRVWLRGFKFDDYYSVFGERAFPTESLAEAFTLCRVRDTSEVKNNVKRVFDSFVRNFL